MEMSGGADAGNFVPLQSAVPKDAPFVLQDPLSATQISNRYFIGIGMPYNDYE